MARKKRYYVRMVDPDVAKETARKGGLARTTPDYHIRKLTELAPALTEDQRQRLAALAAGDAA
jgi:hypothetical protein